MESFNKSRHFIEDIVDGMFDWVRVLDRDDNVIYMNKTMTEAVKNPDIGLKCYEAVGRDRPCDNCISRHSVFDGEIHEKEEKIDSKIFSVLCSPVRNDKGEIIAVVEVLRDTTDIKKMQMELVKQHKKLKDELNMARKLQYSLLPKELPLEGMDFSYIYRPCESLGGDFLDIFKINEDHIGLYIADVSGHGIPASMLTIFLKSALNKKLLSPAKALCELYSEFNSRNLAQDMYITVFYAIIDVKEKTMVYSNAGHNACPLILRSSDTQYLRLPGVPISNWLESPVYEEGISKLKSGDRLFFYTDGIVELKNPAKEFYGSDRLLELLKDEACEPSALLEGILDDARNFAALKDISRIPDDITMALLKID
jgi:sigma-B regulation protein RsbU (phosphoserine phosphatase)